MGYRHLSARRTTDIQIAQGGGGSGMLPSDGELAVARRTDADLIAGQPARVRVMGLTLDRARLR